MTQPSVPSLNIDWGFDHQTQESLSVEKGIAPALNMINQSVKKAEEQEKKYYDDTKKILEETNARYQGEVYSAIEEKSKLLKQVGKDNGFNSRKFREEQERVLRDLITYKKKANYVAERGPELYNQIKTDKYMYSDVAKSDLDSLLSKNLNDIDIDELEALPNRAAYKNVPAMLRDGLDKIYNEEKLSDPFHKDFGTSIGVGQLAYKDIWEQEVDANGKVVFDKGGKPSMKSKLDLNTVEKIIKETGNPEVVYGYFKGLYDRQPEELKPAKDSDGDAYRQAVLGFAKNFIEKTVGSPQSKMISIQRKPTYRPNAAAQAKADKEKKVDEDIKKMTKILKSSAPDAVVDKIKKLDGVKAAKRVKWLKEGYYINEENGEVVNIKELERKGLTRMTKTDGKTQFHKPIDKKYKPFTGVYYTRAGKGEDEGDRTIGFRADFKNEHEIKNLATNIYNMFGENNDASFTTEEEQYDDIDYIDEL
jgi:hypothetical protein